MQRTDTKPRIAWYEAGSSGAPVLLLIGFGMRGVAWHAQIEDLARDHRLIYFDNRGLGHSELGDRQRASMVDFALDALRVLEAAGHERAHVVGVSMGGMAAQELALRRPERVRTLTLIASHAGGPRALLPSLRGLTLFARASLSGPEQRVDAFSKLHYSADFLARVEPTKLRERVALQLEQQGSREALGAQLAAVARHDTRRRLRYLQAPTLIIKPARDLLIRPEHSDHLARAIPRAELLTLAQAGHGAIFECAGEINAALRRHFAQDA